MTPPARSHLLITLTSGVRPNSKKIESVLSDSEADRDKPTSQLSGMKTKLILAKLLPLLVLTSRQTLMTSDGWLGDYLSAKYAYIVISHDRASTVFQIKSLRLPIVNSRFMREITNFTSRKRRGAKQYRPSKALRRRNSSPAPKLM